MTPTPGNLWETLTRTPLHQLPPAFTWVLWSLGAFLAGIPMGIQYLGEGKVTRHWVVASMVLAGVLLFFYGLLAMPPSLKRLQAWIAVALWVGILGLIFAVGML